MNFILNVVAVMWGLAIIGLFIAHVLKLTGYIQ